MKWEFNLMEVMGKYCPMLTPCGGFLNFSVKSPCFYGYRKSDANPAPRCRQLTAGVVIIWAKHCLFALVFPNVNKDLQNKITFSFSLHWSKSVFNPSIFFCWFYQLHYHPLPVFYFFIFILFMIFISLLPVRSPSSVFLYEAHLNPLWALFVFRRAMLIKVAFNQRMIPTFSNVFLSSNKN